MTLALLPLPKTVPSSTKPHGFTIIEAVLSASIFALVVTACFGAFFYGQEVTRSAGKKMQAVFLAQQAVEALRAMRNSTHLLPEDGTYGLDTGQSGWALRDAPDNPVGDLTRTIEITAIDGTKKNVVITIAWPTRTGDQAFILRTILTDWQSVITAP